MGKFAIIIASVFSLIGFIIMGSMQDTSQETGEVQAQYVYGQAAREAAFKGRKMVIAEWIKAGGVIGTQPFATANSEGGVIRVTDYGADPSNPNVIDFTVRGESDGYAHEIRTRYQWNNVPFSPMQIAVADINPTFESGVELNFSAIALDDQPVHELDQVIIQDLGLGTSLSDFNLGIGEIESSIESALINGSIYGTIGLQTIEQSDREFLDSEGGLNYPGQVKQAIDEYVAVNPALHTTINSGSDMPSTFNTPGSVLRIEGDATINASVQGQGVLVVEGDLIIEEGVDFEWDGLIFVNPPISNLNPEVSFKGNVTLNGGLVVLQESIPNSGHMDLTINFDGNGIWTNTYGVQFPYYQHTHDFSGTLNTTQVGYISNTPGFTLHGTQTVFPHLMNHLAAPANDSLVIQILNPGAHGNAFITMELAGMARITSRASIGFDPLIADPINPYRTQPFAEADLVHLDMNVTRMSSLKKLWDSPEGHDGCIPGVTGAFCVGTHYDRFGAMALRVYSIVDGNELHFYDSSVYWHREEDEEDEFEQEMDDLVNTIQSVDYGLDLTLGSNVTISENGSAVSFLNPGGSGPLGISNLGTWQRHWSPTDPGNPLNKLAELPTE